jgi:hypothetical protein
MTTCRPSVPMPKPMRVPMPVPMPVPEPVLVLAWRI